MKTNQRGPVSEGPQFAGNSIFEASATQLYKVGTKLELDDGRTFRYAKAGATALVQAYMAQAAVPLAKTINVVQASHAQAAGDRGKIRCLVTTGGIAASEAWTVDDGLAGGYLQCVKVSPSVLGDIYTIASSKMISETIIELELTTPWRNAMLATGEVTLTMNKFFATVVVPKGTGTAVAVGVPACAVTANYWYWSQTKGPASLIVDTGDTIVAGQYVGNPRTAAVDGACGPSTTVTTEILREVWGTAIRVSTAGEPALVDLCLE